MLIVSRSLSFRTHTRPIRRTHFARLTVQTRQFSLSSEGLNMNELHKKTLTALGFEVKPTEHGNWWVWLNRKWYQVETKSGFMTPVWAVTEDAAWTQAPTLDALMSPLLLVLVKVGDLLWVNFSDGVSVKILEWTRDDRPQPIVYGGIKATPAHAIAALFLAAVESGLVDPKAVVLP